MFGEIAYISGHTSFIFGITVQRESVFALCASCYAVLKLFEKEVISPSCNSGDTLTKRRATLPNITHLPVALQIKSHSCLIEATVPKCGL